MAVPEDRTMKTRMQLCPVCQRQTRHEYQPVSIVLALLLFMCGVVPGFLYVWWAVRRADRTAHCTVDHERLRQAREDERLETMVRALHAVQQPVEQPRRGGGWLK
jgi:hypothetical protein